MQQKMVPGDLIRLFYPQYDNFKDSEGCLSDDVPPSLVIRIPKYK